MSSKLWSPGMVVPIDAQGVGLYTFDYTRWLEGDTIASAEVTGENANVSVAEQDDTTVQVRVQQVTAKAPVRVRVVTTSGRQTDRTVIFRPTEQ